ncbi:MAG: cob(I)yrinic acid a,c-diamide adenosyltransferase [Spirochaetaceae bacterium]|nr:MAG: cob(I)yrinic acid a,c-diamide adenosyltransferase [Spirochaetaceae bacterium]
MQKGLVIVYTGDGKGKTSAALGTALRALGHGMKVCLIRFIKEEKRFSGETAALQAFGNRCEIITAGSGFIMSDKLSDSTEHRDKALAGWEKARDRIISGSFDLVILDEISHLLTLNFLSTAEFAKCISEKPPELHVVLTGRGMPETITALADCVTEMVMLRHPYTSGISNVQGIDF